MANKSTALAVIESEDVLPAVLGAEQLQQTVIDALGDGPIPVDNLPEVKMPSGAQLVFMLNDEPVKELVGTLLFARTRRTYWATDIEDSGGAMPDCSSNDGLYGTGDPGGACTSCPFAEFGTDGGRGQACKETREVFFLLDNQALPIRLRVSPTSIKPLNKYLFSFITNVQNFRHVRTTIGLEKATNADGVDYGLLTFKAERDGQRYVTYSKEAADEVVAWAQWLEPRLQRQAFVAADGIETTAEVDEDLEFEDPAADELEAAATD